MKSALAFLWLILCSCICLAQDSDLAHSNIWYFGDRAGVDFSSGTPVGLTDGQLNTQEGVASISSLSGNFLFYTDGKTIWDKNHNPMPNANSTLNGHWSATQSGVIVPNLNDSMIYYVFTVDELAGSNGLSYTKVDMTLQGNGTANDPLGDVDISEMNVQLVTPVTEKITAIVKAEGESYWVVTHGWNNNLFHAFEVNGDGVNTTPVTTSIGSTHAGGSLNINTVGYMKSSPKGTHIALVNRATNRVDLFNFNKNTGQVVNEVNIIPFDPLLYGLEFSANSKFLFIGGSDNLSRYNVSDGTMIPINIDGTSVFAPSVGVRALQLGPDGKIYVSIRDHDHLSVIHNPVAASPDLTVDGVFLDADGAGRNCRFGLPNIFYFREFTSTALTPEPAFDSEWTIFPNPAANRFLIDLPDEEVSISIYNSTGKVVLKQRSHSDTLINTSGWPDGIYLISIESDQGISTKKLIIHQSAP